MLHSRPPDPGLELTHEHFILDAYLERPLDASRYELITHTLVNHLLAALGMKMLGPLSIYPASDLRAPGWSFIQPITTSHISGHYFEKPGKHPHVRIDAYSCNSVDWRKIIRIVHQELALGAWRGTFINRAIDETDPRSMLQLAGTGDRVTEESTVVARPSAPVLKPGKRLLAGVR
ncbi:MAG: S-adenosylmethionine decarboxylase [Candidatus Peribacteraceae bacterium]|nr:S-adenosylmethionine decarboxylase [Candidatus Peribacteraceae bacterium]